MTMRNQKAIFVSIFTVFLLLFSTSTASAKIMWGKTELKQGQIGKVTILSDTRANKILANKTTQPDKTLKKGGEFRVYTYRVIGDKQFYGLGGGLFVQKTSKIKYETPSKQKLEQLKNRSELAVRIDKKANSILTNEIALNSTKQEVLTKLGNPDRVEYSPYYENDGYLYLFKDGNTNKQLELWVNFTYDGKYVKGISFDLSDNLKNKNWYKALGKPFAVSGNVTYFYLEKTNQVLMFKPDEKHGYVGHADPNFFDALGLENPYDY